METLSNRMVLPLLDWIPPWPVGIKKVVVPETARVPLTYKFMLTPPEVMVRTSNFTVHQVPAVILALPVATLVKAAPGLFQ